MRAYPRKRIGFGLIEILVVIVIISILALIMIPRLTGGKRKPGDKKPHTPIERAHDTAGISYESQINQALMMYRDDNEGRNPPDLASLKKYGVVDEMLVDQVTKQPLAYNPQTGAIGAAAQAQLSGAPATTPGMQPAGAPPRRNVGPGGVSLPNIPSASMDVGGNDNE